MKKHKDGSRRREAQRMAKSAATLRGMSNVGPHKALSVETALNLTHTLVVLATLGLLAACDRGPSKPSPSSAASPLSAASASQAPVNKAQWLAAIEKAYAPVNVRSDGEGMTQFLACFDKENAPKCKVLLSGKRDQFRSIQFFSAPLADWNAMAPSKSALRAYVALEDCSQPSIVFAPVFRGATRWLFIERVAILADDSIIFQRSFHNSDVTRGEEFNELKEFATAVLTDSEVEAVRALPSAKAVVVRISGSKSYVTLEKKFAMDFAKDLVRVLHGYDTFREVNRQLGDIKCAA